MTNESHEGPGYWATLHDRVASVILWKEKCTNAEKRIERLEGAISQSLKLIDEFEAKTSTAWPSTVKVTKLLQSALAAADGQQEAQIVRDAGKVIKGAASILAALDQPIATGDGVEQTNV